MEIGGWLKFIFVMIAVVCCVSKKFDGDEREYQKRPIRPKWRKHNTHNWHSDGSPSDDEQRPYSEWNVTAEDTWNLEEKFIQGLNEDEVLDFSILEAEGNVSVRSKKCDGELCAGKWSGWQPWTECNISIPGKYEPDCHNTLRMRERYCAMSEICHEVAWEFCLNKPSCTGQWTEWTLFDANCTVDCTEVRRRNRTCLSKDGIPASGICIGSKTESFQIESEACDPDMCTGADHFPVDAETALFALAGFFLLVVIAVLIFFLVKFIRERKDSGPLRHVSSSSFLFRSWRVISRRFMSRTGQSNSQPSEINHEVAISSNYTDVHVYENPSHFVNEYAEVQNAPSGSPQFERGEHQSAFDGYEIPLGSTSCRVRSVSGTSDSEYAAVECISPFTGINASIVHNHPGNMKRAQSLDNILIGGRGLGRARHLPGVATKPHRGASQMPTKQSMFKMKASPYPKFGSSHGGAASRITKKKRSLKWTTSSNITCVEIQEDRYGYLVPNSIDVEPVFCGYPNPHQSFSEVSHRSKPEPTKIMKSISLPANVDVDTYVTMRSSSGSRSNSAERHQKFI